MLAAKSLSSTASRFYVPGSRWLTSWKNRRAMASAATAAPPATPSPSDYGTTKWWDASTVAVVTGANRGIGTEVARLLTQLGMTVVVAARNESAGKATADSINKVAGDAGGRAVSSPPLELADGESVKRFAEWLKATYGRVGVLVNNAGMAYKGDVFGPAEVAATLATNYYGTVALTEAVLPLVARPGGRVVTVSSRAGLTTIIPDDRLRARFMGATSLGDVDALVEEFKQAVQEECGAGGGGALARAGWPRSMYGLSKLALSTYCRLRAKQLEGEGVVLTACCPGYCATDMTSWKGTKPAAQGADTPVWLAVRPPSEAVPGQLWAERTEHAW